MGPSCIGSYYLRPPSRLQPKPPIADVLARERWGNWAPIDNLTKWDKKTVSNETILIVEDDSVVIKILETQFRAAGYKVVAAHSTAEAIRSTVTHQPDLMILDLTLLDGVSVNGLLDGLSLLEWLRRMLPEARFPVIIHTASTAPDLEERTRSFGVKGVFRKGEPIQQLVDAVRLALDKREAA